MKSWCLRLSVVPVPGSLYHSEGLGGSIQQVIIFFSSTLFVDFLQTFKKLKHELQRTRIKRIERSNSSNYSF
jgi:hypothetical protein